MSVKGEKKQESLEFSKSVGLAAFKVVAINPTRQQLNKLLNKEAKEDEEELEYLGQDNEGIKKVKLTIWLEEERTGKYFSHTLSLIDKIMTSKKGKIQYINSVLDTAYVDDTDNLQSFFTHFLNKEKKPIGEKEYRKALIGEESLGLFMKAWLGKLNFNHTTTAVDIDPKKLIKGNFKEMQSLIEDEDFTTKFVGLLGVKTDDNDDTKQYQVIYKGAYLPYQMMKHINNGIVFPNEYTKNSWKRFVEKVSGEYGFKAFYKLEPMSNYDKSEDLAFGGQVKEPSATGSDYL